MEFESRKSCIEHYQGQFPNLPRYMIEMALDYDLQNGGTTNEKPKTNKEKRKQKQATKAREKRDTTFQDTLEEALNTGKPLEIDCATIIKASEFKQAPFVSGYISVDGMEVKDMMEQVEITEEEVDGLKDRE